MTKIKSWSVGLWMAFGVGMCLTAWLGAAPDGKPGSGGVSDTAKQAGAEDVVAAARWQVGRTLEYDPSYQRLAYPNGDIAIIKGVCTDVVIRALRRARKMDLQKRVHEDMRAHFTQYPKNWGLQRPDRHIDHRRVPNLRTYFRRQGWSLKVTDKAGDYLPGDLVTCTVAGKLPHIMIVSDRRDGNGTPMVIHNIGAGVREEGRLFEFPITGHYRLR